MDKIKSIIVAFAMILVTGPSGAQSLAGSLKGKVYYDLGHSKTKSCRGLESMAYSQYQSKQQGDQGLVHVRREL
jgi:hypothetical protein